MSKWVNADNKTPKDMSIVLVYTVLGRIVESEYWSFDDIFATIEEGDRINDVTHWRKRPKVPKD